MKSHYRVAVIGGGVVGCSVLYHLTKLGWRDVVLLERKELTAGSSWHAAAGFHALNSDPRIAQLQAYTIALYKEIEPVSGHSVGMHMSGGLNIAATRERWEFLRADHARHRVLGLETELLGPSEIKSLCPLLDVTHVVGAIYDPREGHVDPIGATYAYAKAAQANGAEICLQTRVTGLEPTGRGTWRVRTERGEIEAEHVVNAAGLWAREMGALVGVTLPFIPIAHQFIVTERLPEVAARSTELPLVIDLDAEVYMRQEGDGLLIGVYEKDPTPWAVGGTPWEHGQTELLPPRMEGVQQALTNGCKRFPFLVGAGVRRIVNGPFSFTADGNPLVGPVPGVPNYWVACGVVAGFAQGGGVGLSLAQWLIHGEPEGEIFGMDVGRFGPGMTRAYVIAKAREFYANRFRLAYPNEHRPAGRPARTGALYDALQQRNAVFGVSYMTEVPLYFAPAGEAPCETPTFKRSNAFPVVAEEVRVVQERVGVLDSSSFAKYDVSGPGAAAALDRLLASRLPAVGRIRLAPMLSESGRLMGDLTVMRLAEDSFLLFGSGYLQAWHSRWFMHHLPAQGVVFRNVTDELQGMVLAGPRSRALLQRLTSLDLDRAAFPFLAVRRAEVGLAPAIIGRLSLTGELAFEIYTPASYVRPLYAKILETGQDLGVADFGIYATLSMRLEKGFGVWSREYSRDYTAAMAGLDRFIDFTKPEFVGREAALREREQPPRQRLVTFAVEATDADAAGHEPIWHDGQRVGYVTSGGYGHRVETSVAMGYVDRAVSQAEQGFEISIVGARRPARRVPAALYDPDGLRPRS